MSLTKVSYSMINGDVVNVLDYGAVGDNATDSTVAIQAAIDYAAPLGKAVFIPAGTYKITTLELPRQHGGIEIFGEAYDSQYNFENDIFRGSVLVSTATTGNVISCDGGVYYSNRGIRISNLNMKVVTSGYAIYLNGSPEFTQIKNCAIYNACPTGGNGIGLVNCWVGGLISGCAITNETISSFDSHGVLIRNDIKAGGIVIENSAITHFYQNLYVGDQLYQVSVRNTSMEGGTFGAWIEGSNSTVGFDTCHFEYDTANAINVVQSTAVSVFKCSFYNNSTTPVYQAAEIRISGGGVDYNPNVLIQQNNFFGIGTNVTAIYVINSAYSNGVINNNYVQALGTNTTGVYIGAGDSQAFTVTNNQFYDGITTPYSPTTIQTYKQSAWTPIDASGAGLTFSSASGTYTKNGNVVFIQGTVTYPSTANTSAAVIGGLPFPVQTVCILPIVTDASITGSLYSNPLNTTMSVVNTTNSVNITNATLSTKVLVFSGFYTIA